MSNQIAVLACSRFFFFNSDRTATIEGRQRRTPVAKHVRTIMQLSFLIGVLIFGCCTANHNYVLPGTGAPCSPPPGYVRRACRTLTKLSEKSEVLPAPIYGCVYVINISNNDYVLIKMLC